MKRTERGFVNNEQGFSDTEERGFITIARFQQYRVSYRQHGAKFHDYGARIQLPVFVQMPTIPQ